MKETLLTNSERSFVLGAIADNQRLDGRQTYDYRNIKISFGADRGCCQVLLGETRILAQVSCEVECPKPARPVEGIFHINVELSPMAAPHFEPGRPSAAGVELTRLLERCLKDSRCLDLDSLCIVSGEKVWSIRVDVHVLNADGNLADCAVLAAVTALSHFRRPDLTISSDGVTVHSIEEKSPVPLGIYHVPLCVTFAFFQEGNHLLLDPTDLEERVMDGKMVLGMNVYREICTLHMSGKMLLHRDQVLRCADIAAKRVADLTVIIKDALSKDAGTRVPGGSCGFGQQIETDKILKNRFNFVATASKVQQTNEEKTNTCLEAPMEITRLAPGTALMGADETCKWESSDEEEMEETEHPKKTPTEMTIASDSSEEDEVVTLSPENTKNCDTQPSRGWYNPTF